MAETVAMTYRILLGSLVRLERYGGGLVGGIAYWPMQNRKLWFPFLYAHTVHNRETE